MGVLDDLKKQAESTKARQQAEEERREALESFCRTDILSKLSDLYTYLFELSEYLNYVKPEIALTYELEGCVSLDVLRQCAYEINVDSRQNMKKIDFDFPCEGDGEPVAFKVEGKKRAEETIQFLRNTGLTFRHKQRRGGQEALVTAQFVVERKVPVRFGFTANLEQGAIDLTIKNFEALRLLKLQVKPDAITEDYLEKLAKYILAGGCWFSEA
jgi:hypothetical protein